MANHSLAYVENDDQRRHAFAAAPPRTWTNLAGAPTQTLGSIGSSAWASWGHSHSHLDLSWPGMAGAPPHSAVVLPWSATSLSGASAPQPPTPIDVGGWEDHDGGVGFTGKLTVGELAPVKSPPLSLFDWRVGPWPLGPTRQRLYFRVLFISFLEFCANFRKSYLEL